MADPLDGPQIDDRPPGFACKPSYGMLGPKRVVVFAGSLPASLSHLSGGMVLPYLVEGGVSPPWFVQYRRAFGPITVNFFVAWLVPSAGLYSASISVNAGSFPLVGSASRSITNFTWQFPGLVLGHDAGPYGDWIVHRVAEWQTITKRFPDAAFGAPF